VNDSPTSCASASCPQPALCPLNRVQVGALVRIKQLDAAGEVSLRLREMGLGEEQEVRLLSCASTVICQVCNTRLGLSPQLAERILVQPVPCPPPGAPA
jgi:Fe2+ transport system protein FeoA